MSKIGIFETGSVGRTLAEKLTSLGNEVMIGTRNVENTMAKTEPDILGRPPYKEWQIANQNIKLGTFAEVADFGDISESFWLETLRMTWIYFAFKNQSWSHAFKLFRK